MTPFPVRHPLPVPSDWPPTLAVVIDTEEEFDWNAPFDPARIGTANIDCQELAQRLLDAHGVVPTYVVDYPVATAPRAASVLRALVAAGRAEVGAHLHPWTNPPGGERQDAYHSYPGNLPPELERAKLAALTAAIEANIGARPRVYKAGRYGVGPATAGILRELGYAVDVSVMPHTDFSADGGPDFRALPDGPFAILPGLVELPLSVHFTGSLARVGRHVFPCLASPPGRRLHLPGIAARLGLLERLRLSPEGHALDDMLRQTRAALARGTRLFMLTWHSSSLLPGATSYVRDMAQRERFLARIDAYCRIFFGPMGGRAATVTGVAAALQAGGRAISVCPAAAEMI